MSCMIPRRRVGGGRTAAAALGMHQAEWENYIIMGGSNGIIHCDLAVNVDSMVFGGAQARARA